MVEKVTVYRTKDGSVFDHESVAERHERILVLTDKMLSSLENFTNYLKLERGEDTRTATVQFLQGARREIKEFLNLGEVSTDDTMVDYEFYRFSRLIDHTLIDVYKLAIPYNFEMEIKLKMYDGLIALKMTENDDPYEFAEKYIADNHDKFVNQLKEVADK